MNVLRTLALLLFVLIAVPSATAQIAEPPVAEVLATLSGDLTHGQTTTVGEQLAALTGTRLVGCLHYRPVVRLALDGQDLDATLTLLRADPRVAVAEPNHPVHTLSAPMDPALYTYQWGFRRTGGPPALPRIRDLMGTPVVLAILDTGVDERHPEFAGRLVAGWDVIDDDDLPRDAHGHGTHVAGIAAAATFNDLGIASPFPGKIMPVRVLAFRDNFEGGTAADVADGVDYARLHGAHVINFSIGVDYDVTTLQAAIEAAAAAGVVMVAANGESGFSSYYYPSYPADYDEVIAVIGWSFSGHRISGTTYGPEVELAAPGEKIYGPFLHGGYQLMDGNSVAAPLVAGTAGAVYAELLRNTPMLDHVQAAACVRQILQDSAEDLMEPGRDQYSGFGMVRIDRALEMAETYQCTP